jgi:hypothetical protein
MTHDGPSSAGSGAGGGGPARPALLAYRTASARRPPWDRRVLWAALAVQALLVAFQVCAVCRFRGAAPPHVPTPAEWGRRDWVAVAFEGGTVYVPTLGQFLLVPLAASLAVDHFGRARVGSVVVFLTAALAVAAWGLALAVLMLSGALV